MSRLPSTDVFRALCWAVAAVGLAACGSTPTAPATQASVPVETVAGGDAKASSAEATTTPLDAPAAAVAQPVDVPPRAAADFDRALNFMRAGNVTEAELELKQLAEAYPQLAAPHVNLGLLYRKSGKLDQAEAALETATARNGASAIAWNELGVTRRMRGRFKEAARCVRACARRGCQFRARASQLRSASRSVHGRSGTRAHRARALQRALRARTSP